MTVALDRRGDGIGDVIGAGALRLRGLQGSYDRQQVP
jgi:hypothetical protein